MNFKFLPNLITLFNLFLGCIVTLLLIENNLEVKYVFIITVICLILDYLDGYISNNLYSDNDVPLIHYRAVEKLFCQVTSCVNIASKDVSYDAIKEDEKIVP